MPQARRYAALWMIGASTLLGAGPCAMCPGDRIDGELVTAPVTDWHFIGERAACEIEARPDEPHSVRATCLQSDGDLYVGSAFAPRKRWPKLVADDDRVRVGIEGRIYQRRATRITDVEERIRVLGGSRADPPSASHWLWRLDPR